jgi:hypothetical protein
MAANIFAVMATLKFGSDNFSHRGVIVCQNLMLTLKNKYYYTSMTALSVNKLLPTFIRLRLEVVIHHHPHPHHRRHRHHHHHKFSFLLFSGDYEE